MLTQSSLEPSILPKEVSLLYSALLSLGKLR